MEITTENKTQYVLVRIVGELSPKDLVEKERIRNVAAQAFALAKQNHIPKMLIDLSSMTAILDTMDRYDVINIIAERSMDFLVAGGGQPIKIALITNPGISDARNFSETLARNRGVNMIVTLDRSHAMQWLGVEAS